MITREEAIAYFKRHLDLYCVEGISREAEEMAIKALDQNAKYRKEAKRWKRKALEQMPSWIPVSERLPNKNGTYLVTIEICIGRHIEVLDYANDLYKIDKFDFNDKKGVAGWYVFDGEWGFIEEENVTAWMPLPQPYAESEDK